MMADLGVRKITTRTANDKKRGFQLFFDSTHSLVAEVSMIVK